MSDPGNFGPQLLGLLLSKIVEPQRQFAATLGTMKENAQDQRTTFGHRDPARSLALAH
jgi:hypothetical protein